VRPNAGLPGEADVTGPMSAMTAPATTEDDIFTRFVRDTFSTVSRCARKWCNDETKAKDLVQESYIQVYRTHNPAEELRLGYVLNALRWALIDDFRKEERERDGLGEVGRSEARKVAKDPAKLVVDRAEIIWLAEKFLDPLHSNRVLRQRQWEVLILTALGDYSAREVGARLGLAPATVRNYLTLIREALRALRVDE
jgi:RNA polymerase sigma factor (sigma-70 family)